MYLSAARPIRLSILKLTRESLGSDLNFDNVFYCRNCCWIFYLFVRISRPFEATGALCSSGRMSKHRTQIIKNVGWEHSAYLFRVTKLVSSCLRSRWLMERNNFLSYQTEFEIIKLLIDEPTTWMTHLLDTNATKSRNSSSRATQIQWQGCAI